MKKALIVSVVFCILIGLMTVSAVPEQAKTKQEKIDKGPLTKITFIHYKKAFGKPSGCNNDGVCQGWESPDCSDCQGSNGNEKSKCYGFIAKGLKLKETKTYVINRTNSFGLSNAFVESAVSAGAEAWDEQVSQELFNNSYAVNDSVVSGQLDGNNAIAFGDYPQQGVIAVTHIWGYFYGNPKTREIIEFDITWDTDFVWENAADSNNSNVMDLQNISTHEFGHAAGMDDLYETSCMEETMYGYSEEGETKKRTLETGDITGIKKLYGS